MNVVRELSCPSLSGKELEEPLRTRTSCFGGAILDLTVDGSGLKADICDSISILPIYVYS